MCNDNGGKGKSKRREQWMGGVERGNEITGPHEGKWVK